MCVTEPEDLPVGQDVDVEDSDTDDLDPVQGQQHECSAGSSQDHLPPGAATPTPGQGEEQEVYYASLSFQGLRLREPEDQEAPSSTEYSAIKIHKRRPPKGSGFGWRGRRQGWFRGEERSMETGHQQVCGSRAGVTARTGLRFQPHPETNSLSKLLYSSLSSSALWTQSA
ncbi:sialic acid-binding Ig-like lectin 11 [Macaca nemestrina]|uniref:sialic acid-binding Ig-like lectin 11 n=1 Tax=Macaca nemestrina TaxID=9545 RepID=UPI0039B9985E